MDSIPSPTHYSLNLNDEIIASELQESLLSRARARAMKHSHALAEESAASASSNLPSRRGRPPNRVANQGFAFTLHPPDESEDNDAQELVRPFGFFRPSLSHSIHQYRVRVRVQSGSKYSWSMYCTYLPYVNATQRLALLLRLNTESLTVCAPCNV